MARIYSTLFFSGTVVDGVTTLVAIPPGPDTVVIRTVRVVCTSSLPALSWAVSVPGGPNFLYAQGVGGPFTDVQAARDVWPPGFGMDLNCTGANMDFWVTGYVLTP